MPDAVANRSRELFEEKRQAVFRRTDRFMAGLLLVQWLALILVALVYSPTAWAWDQGQVHLHLTASLLLGGLIVALPLALVWQIPGARPTRMLVAAAQMLLSALFIHLSGGRIESHFHVFASLAILSIYRDWEVFVPATIVVALDHGIRGFFFPMSVFGVANASPLRTLEHAWWVIFEDAFVIWACLQGQRDMLEMSRQQAHLEVLKNGMETRVLERTSELEESQRRLKTLVDMLTALMSQIQVAGIQVAGAAAISATARQQQASVGHLVAQSLHTLKKHRAVLMAQLLGRVHSTFL